MMGYYYGYGFTMFWIMLICIALVIAAVVLIAKAFGGNRHSYSNSHGKAVL